MTFFASHSVFVFSFSLAENSTNAKTAMRVGQALGVMIFSAAQHDSSVFEYAPGTIKKMVAGSGRADKKDVQKSLRKVLGAKVRSQKRKKTRPIK